MRDRDELERKVQRGIEAEQVLGMPIIADAHDKIERAIVEAIKRCSLRDKEGLLELCGQLKENERHRQVFKTAVETGKVAKKDLSLMDRMLRRVA